MLASAGATLYAAVAAVPGLLVAIGIGSLLLGRDRTGRYGRLLAEQIPGDLGAGTWVRALFDAGLSLSPLSLALALFMGTAYGRGLSRALRRLAPEQQQDLPPAWWSRAMTLPLLGAAPLLLIALLLAMPAMSHLNDEEGVAGLLGASYLALNLVWVVTTLPLTWAFRVVAPGHPRWGSAVIGGLVTGAFISGFLQGFLVFLALPVDLGRPFGGLAVVGVVSALLLWLWVLHLVVCAGYALTWEVDAVRSSARSPSDSPSDPPSDPPSDAAPDPASGSPSGSRSSTTRSRR
jgi:membrane protein